MELTVFYFRKCLLSTKGYILLIFHVYSENHTQVSVETNTVVLF